MGGKGLYREGKVGGMTFGQRSRKKKKENLLEQVRSGGNGI